MRKLNIVFAGTPEFGIPCLQELIKSHHLSAIYTQPDRPSGRGQKLMPSAVKRFALEHHIPVHQPLNFKSQESLDALAALQPDVMVVIAYGLILPKAVLEIPRLGCVNVHASLLPRWRGASPIQHAVLAGDSQSGVTIMQMDVGMDTGAMLSKVACPIKPTDTAGSLHDTLAQLAPQVLISTLIALSQGQAQAQSQDQNLATYAGKIAKADACLDWTKSAIELDRTIRAYYPWPIAYTMLEHGPLRIYKARPTDIDCSQQPGTILALDKQGMLIATSAKALLIESIQFPGGKVISVADWLNAGKMELQVGLVLK